MRVLILTTSYPVSADSVSGVFVARVAQNLPANIQVTVVAPAPQRRHSINSSNRITIKTFRYAPRRLQVLAHGPGGIPVALRTYKWAFLLLPTFLLSMLLACWYYGRGASVIHANWTVCGVIAGLAGKFSGIPVVTTLRGEDVTRAQRSWLDRSLLVTCLILSTRVVCVSNAIESWVRKVYPRHGAKALVIENGVDESLLRIPLARPDSGPIRVVTVGSLIPRKNVELIVLALRDLGLKRRMTLAIVGTGPEQEHLEQLARTSPECHVEFLGAVQPPAIPRILSEAHVFVLASRSEGRPNVILEAMAAGVPVVASNIPGVDELVDHGENGLLFEPGNAAELAEQLRLVAFDPILREKLGRAARECIVQRQLIWRVTATKYAELYQTTTAGSRQCAES